MKIDVLLDQKEFLRFSFFDALHCRRVWRLPALFAAILCACAGICFFRPEIRGAAPLGIVLLAVGLGLPAVYFLSFYLSLRQQGEKLNGTGPVYTVELSPGDGGITVDNGREHAVYPWEQVFHVYRNGSATYLYMAPRRAFLIPHACVKGGAERLWELIGDRVPEERRTVLR